MGEDRRNRYQNFFSLFHVYCFHLEGQSSTGGSQFPIWEVSWREAKLNADLRLLLHTVWMMIEIGPLGQQTGRLIATWLIVWDKLVTKFRVKLGNGDGRTVSLIRYSKRIWNGVAGTCNEVTGPMW